MLKNIKSKYHSFYRNPINEGHKIHTRTADRQAPHQVVAGMCLVGHLNIVFWRKGKSRVFFLEVAESYQLF